MLILIFIIFYNGRDNNSVISLHNKLLIIMKIVYQYLIIVEGVQLTVIYIDLFFGVLTPLSALFQLYHGDQLLVVEEAGVPGENHRRWESNWEALSLAVASRVHPFCNLQNRCANPGRIGDRLVGVAR